MAARVNTKFVIILALVLVVLVGGIATAGWFALYRRDADRYVTRARQFVEEGLYSEAIEQLSRAHRYERNREKKVGILLELADTHGLLRVDTMDEAQKRLRHLQNCWTQARQLEPDHQVATKSLLEFQYKRAQMFPASVQVWTGLYNTCDEILNVVPDMTIVRKYRGIAMTSRMERIDVNEDERLQAREDLEAALAADPADGEVIYQLAVWHWVESQAQRRLGRETKADELAAAAEEIVRKHVADQPDDVQAQLGLVRMLTALARTPQIDQAKLDEALSLLKPLETKLASGEMPAEAIEVANHLTRLDREQVKLADGTMSLNGMVRAENLLRNVVRSNPENLELIMILGGLLERQGRVSDAIEYFRLAKKDRPIPISIEALRIGEYQVWANKKLADLYLAQYEREQDETKKAEWLEQARAEADELAERASGHGWVDLIRGKLAYVDGDLRRAAKLLDSASKQFEGQPANFDVLRLSAQALLRLGETGAAAARLEQLIATPRGRLYVKPYLDLARLRLREFDTERAMTYLDFVLKAQPENSEALLLKSEVLARRAQTMIQASNPQAPQTLAEALEILKSVPDQDSRQIVQQYARLMQMSGNTEAAQQRLAAYYAKNNDDMVVLQQLVRLLKQLGRNEEAIAMVDQAIEREPDRKVLQVIARSLRGETEAVADEVEQLLTAESDPIARDLKLHSFYKQTDRLDEAKKHLDAAIQAAPDDERVMTVQFDLAIADKDFDAAQALAERAATMRDGVGLDHAKGMFWLGRVQLAQGKHREAVRLLDQAVQEMPVNSQGWMLLGDARRGAQNLIGAETAYRQSVELKPDNPQAWRRLFQIHDARGQHELAIQDLEQVMHYSRGDRNVYMAYLNYLARHGNADDVLQRRLKLAEQRPDDQANLRAIAELYLRQQQSAQAKAIIDRLMTKSPDDAANLWLAARYHAANGDYAQGETLIREHVHGRGEQATSDDWAMYARFLRLGNKTDSAIAAYEQAITREDPGYMGVSRELADWLFSSRQAAKSVPLYEKILINSGNNVVVWRRYVEALVQADLIDEAATQLKALFAAASDAEAKFSIDAQMHLLDGVIATKQGRREDASAAYDAAVNLERANPLVYQQRAQFRMTSDVPAERALARADLEKAIELDQKAILPREALVQWHLDRKDPTAAIGELQRLIAVQPRYAPARVRLAELYVTRGPAAAGALERLIDDSQTQMPNLVLWDQLRAQAVIMNLPASADFQTRVRAYAESANYYAKVYERSKNVRTANLLATAYLNARQGPKALEVLNDWPAELAKSGHLQAMRARGLAMQGGEFVDQAKRVFTKAMEIAGDNRQALGSVLTHMQSALPVTDQKALIEPRLGQDPTGQLQLAMGQLELRTGKYDQAIDRLVQLHQRMPDETNVLRVLASGCYMADRKAESRKYYELLLTKQQDDLMALNNLAYMLADDLDEAELAIAKATRALELVGRDEIQRANVMDTLGWVQFRAGHIDEAVDTLRRSVALNPMAANCLHLGEVLAKRGENDMAREQLMRARRFAEESKDNDTLKRAEQLLQSIDSAAVAQ